MDINFYRNIIYKSSLGYALHEIVNNAYGVPDDFRFMEMNGAFERILSVKLDKLVGTLGKEVYKKFGFHDFEWASYFKTIAVSGAQIQMEQYIKPKGRWFRIEIISVSSDRFVTLIDDITLQKQAKADLNSFFEVNLDLLCIADTDGNFIRVNKAWGETLGYSQSELEKRNFLDFVHPDDLNDTLSEVSKLSQGVEVHNFTNRYRRKDGTYRYIEWRSHPKGKIIFAAARDVTDRIESSSKLERLIGISEGFLSDYSAELNFQLLTDYALEISGAKYALWSLYAKSQGTIEVKALSGGSNTIGRLAEFLGFSITDRVWELDPQRESTIKDSIVTVFPDIGGACGTAIPPAIQLAIAKAMNLGQSVIAKIALGDETFGEFTLVMPSGKPFTSSKLVELYVRQVAILVSRARARADLAAREGLMSNLVKQVPGIIFQFQMYPNGSYRFHYISEGITDLYGILPSEVLQNPDSAFLRLPDDQRREFFQSVKKSFDTLEDWTFDFRVDTLVGKDRRYRGNAKPRPMPDKSVVWYGYLGDITDTKRLEDILTDSEEKFRSIVDQTADMIFLYELDGKIVDVNQAALIHTGYTKDELLSMHVFDLYPDITNPSPSSQYAGELKEADKPLITEYVHRAKDGIMFPVEISVSKVNFSKKEFMLALVRNITERKQAQEALLREKNFADLVLKTMGQGLTITNAKGQFTFVNTAYARMIGCEPTDIVGKEPQHYVAPESHDALSQARRDRLKGRVTTYEVTLQSVTGTAIPVVVTGVPIQGNGEYSGSIAVITDISEQKEAQKEINRQNEALKRANAEKDKFFSIIAHDIKSPLSGFIGLTELLSSKIYEFNISRIQEVSSALRDSAQGLYTLLDNLLEWSKLQRGIVNLEPAWVSLTDAVDSILELLGPAAEAKGVLVNIDVDALPYIYADENMLRSLLRNLLSNAIKFSHKDGRIDVKASVDSDCFQISISDTGIGIPDEILHGLFDPTKKTSRKGTGGEYSSGLGLILCKEFIELHNGTIRVETRVGEGSTFYIAIPKPKDNLPLGEAPVR